DTETSVVLAGGGGAGGGGTHPQSSAIGVAGAVSFNDVEGGARATGNKAKLTATGGGTLVSRTEGATLTARTESQLLATETISAKRRSAVANAGGLALAASGIVGTNVVLSAADAVVSDSTLTANAGDVTVVAINSATLTAEAVNSSTTSLE